MNKNTDGCIGIQILPPLTGIVVLLEDVPDPVFSQKVIGDGTAVLPWDGRLVSLVDGEVISVADTPHARGLRPDESIEIMVHSGLEIVSLKGELFTYHIKPGDKAKAGDLLAEADLKGLEEKQVNTITPVLTCGGMEDRSMNATLDPVTAGKGVVITLLGQCPPEAESSQTAPDDSPVSKLAKKKSKSLINFDFLQKLGKVLMTVIAVMSVASLMISVGKLIQMADGNMDLVTTLGSIMKTIGWAIINNLHILFAIAVGGFWVKEWVGGAFAAVIAFTLINVITGALLRISSADLNDPVAATRIPLGQEILVNGYSTSVLGVPALSMGVLVGVIAGFTGGVIYNKYYNYRKLPDALVLSNGKRFVPMVVIAQSVIISLVLALAWPVVQTGINSFGIWIVNSSSTSPALASFIYGILERLSFPFGPHHMLIVPMNYISFGGTHIILTGVSAGSQVFDQDPLWLAWATDLINLQNAGDAAGYQNLLAIVIPTRFKAGQMIGATGLLLGTALAVYRCVDPGKRKNHRLMFLSIVLAVLLTGVTKPLEFMFISCVLPLYLVYVVLQGCASAMAGIIHLRLYSFGNLEFLIHIPMSIWAGLGGDVIHLVICIAVFFATGYATTYFATGKFRFATPGRLGNYTDGSATDETGSPSAGAVVSGNSQAERIISPLGGRDNIVLVDACTTRLRATVKDVGKAAELSVWKVEGAMGLIKRDEGIQAVYGPKADVLKFDINDIL